MPYNVIQTLLDPLWGKGTQAYFKATNLSRLDDALIEKLAEVHLQVPGPQAEIHIHQMGGAVARVPEDATSFSERSMPFVLNAVTGWHDGARPTRTSRGLGRSWKPRRRASTGRAYVNYLGDPGAGRSAYGTETYERLAALKREYDPTNVFRLNQNIEP